ncbi:uncharacterized protein PHACADRAFT_248713 [Phanerochaete carnosa HHB-10118-sp]|uniref:Uncharacterized protein n=1 Tax=Phanerochaete carnosa (strain HHB-10118-sp) TaxID=650164 RepID=K5VFR2_PHACS|nr:uncharacterized protein PHACADRAFT_248713 [Phanerochaete carnosa HHB-10118-sp]EKM61841.1 hypothetical protein PHACADRAFT_248713 [Phanerochaete carnosa HHB-10118-sp]
MAHCVLVRSRSKLRQPWSFVKVVPSCPPDEISPPASTGYLALCFDDWAVEPSFVLEEDEEDEDYRGVDRHGPDAWNMAENLTVSSCPFPTWVPAAIVTARRRRWALLPAAAAHVTPVRINRLSVYGDARAIQHRRYLRVTPHAQLLKLDLTLLASHGHLSKLTPHGMRCPSNRACTDPVIMRVDDNSDTNAGRRSPMASKNIRAGTAHFVPA